MAEIKATSIPVRSHKELIDVHTPHIGDEIGKGEIHLDNFKIGTFDLKYTIPYLIKEKTFDASIHGYRYMSDQWYYIIKKGLLIAKLKTKLSRSSNILRFFIAIWNRTTNELLGYLDCEEGEYESELRIDKLHDNDILMGLIYNKKGVSGATFTAHYYYLELRYRHPLQYCP